MLNLLQHDKVKAGLPFLGVVAAHNLLYYGITSMVSSHGMTPNCCAKIRAMQQRRSNHGMTPLHLSIE
ncbi:hypothetical protein [Rickettsia endosymbiont of Orchestes rusci]|uniref:hypothetical protein n=1 Tax=Rickettsia endosymbiont of Orchestes rusci TaxID=3066250 RepID=UPI00313B3F1C